MGKPPPYNALNGLNPLAYMGVNPYTPPDLMIKNHAPTPVDFKNIQIGTLWLDFSPPIPTGKNIWMLVSVAQNYATWVQFGAVGIQSLTGNTGGAVFSDNNSNINTVGGTAISVVGDPATNTLTWNNTGVTSLDGLTGGLTLEPGTGITITNNSGSGQITIASTALQSLTITGTDMVPVSPSAMGNINLIGVQNYVTTTGDPGSNTININAPITILTDDDITVSPNSDGNFLLTGLLHIVTAGVPDENIITISTTFEHVTEQFTTDDGSTVLPTLVGPPSGNVNVFGSGGVYTTGTIDNTITIHYLNWNTINASTQALAVSNAYIGIYSGLITYTLPTVAVVGDIIEIIGNNASGSWHIAQNSGQLIRLGKVVTTTGVTGFLESTNAYDGIKIVCITANTTWYVERAVGNITYN